MHGQVAKRTAVHFGYRYGYESWKLTAGLPLPPALTWVRDRAGSCADIDPELFAEILVTRYPAGAGIGWHRDAPLFGPKVVWVSVSPCTMRFQLRTGSVRRTRSGRPGAPLAAFSSSTH